MEDKSDVDNRKSMDDGRFKTRIIIISLFLSRVFCLGIGNISSDAIDFVYRWKQHTQKKRNHLRKSIIYVFLFCATFFFLSFSSLCDLKMRNFFGLLFPLTNFIFGCWLVKKEQITGNAVHLIAHSKSHYFNKMSRLTFFNCQTLAYQIKEYTHRLPPNPNYKLWCLFFTFKRFFVGRKL